jgi:hypothetical protein
MKSYRVLRDVGSWLRFLFVLSGTLGFGLRTHAVASVAAGAPIEVAILDATGMPLDLRYARASISRGLPGDLPLLTHRPDQALDAQSLRFVFCGAPELLPKTVSVQTTKRSGDVLAVLRDVPLSAAAALGKQRPNRRCAQTPLLRVTADAQDAAYVAARERSLEGEIGGYLQLTLRTRMLSSLLVGGPRELTTVTGIVQAKLRARIVRTFPGGVPPFGRDDTEAVSVLRSEIHTANQLWGQCGITFGDEALVDIAVIDPPAPYLLSVGCGFAVAGQGGQINVLLDGKLLSVETHAGDVPRVATLRVARAAERLGFQPAVQTNPRVLSSALPSFDIEFRRANGQWATIAPANGRPLSSDPTLGVCAGVVDLTDGLEHFTNVSSMTGTLEERSLLRAVIDDDIGTIDVVVVESFSRVGRIGESFVASEAGSLGNVVVLNRAAFRVGARSFALAHELGHILLDEPGHPDDYGVDTPWNLMDSDAVDGTVFGPKHLTRDDCQRALVQSGQQSVGTLLKPW